MWPRSGAGVGGGVLEGEAGVESRMRPGGDAESPRMTSGLRVEKMTLGLVLRPSPRDLLTILAINRQGEKTSRASHRGKAPLSNYLNNSMKHPSYDFLGKGDFACNSLNEFT